jgi:hypothetical protein
MVCIYLQATVTVCVLYIQLSILLSERSEPVSEVCVCTCVCLQSSEPVSGLAFDDAEFKALSEGAKVSL